MILTFFKYSVLGGRNVKTSIDIVDKTYAVQLGYVFKDFIEFESIELWSDQLNPKQLDRRGPLVQTENQKQKIVMKLSQDPRENSRVFKQLKYNIAFSQTLTLFHLINIKLRGDGW
jgi:hypothetical protein